MYTAARHAALAAFPQLSHRPPFQSLQEEEGQGHLSRPPVWGMIGMLDRTA
jgi:hypothetical protein